MPAGKPAAAIKLRAGDHPDKTRFVVEVDREADYKVAIDPVRNVLQVRFENVDWKAPKRGKLEDTKLLGQTGVADTPKKDSISSRTKGSGRRIVTFL